MAHWLPIPAVGRACLLMATGIPDPTSTITRILARIAIFYRQSTRVDGAWGGAAVLLSPFSTQTAGEMELLKCLFARWRMQRDKGRLTLDARTTLPLIADSFRITVR